MTTVRALAPPLNYYCRQLCHSAWSVLSDIPTHLLVTVLLESCDFLMMQCDEVLPLTVAQVYLFIKEYLSTVSRTKYKVIVKRAYSCLGSTKILHIPITSLRSYVRNAYMHN